MRQMTLDEAMAWAQVRANKQKRDVEVWEHRGNAGWFLFCKSGEKHKPEFYLQMVMRAVVEMEK